MIARHDYVLKISVEAVCHSARRCRWGGTRHPKKNVCVFAFQLADSDVSVRRYGGLNVVSISTELLKSKGRD